jgi:hypothetical protein
VRPAAPPLSDGEYSFALKDAEFPLEDDIDVTVRIRGERISVVNQNRAGVFPEGLIEEGTLLWHPASKQWIIGQSEADASAPQVGGCGAGPRCDEIFLLPLCAAMSGVAAS